MRLRAKFFSMTPFDQGWVKVPNLRAAGGSEPA
jgi:hypothetical protein